MRNYDIIIMYRSSSSGCSMNNNRGFTIIEMIIVVIIMGIVAALAAVKYQKTMAANDLEKAANNLYIELRGLRPLMFKYDDTIVVLFSPIATPPQFTTSVWASDDPAPAFKTISTYKLASPIKIGIPPTNPPSQQPYTDAWWTANAGAIVNGLQGEWKTRLYVNPNSRAQYAQGGVYLYNPRLEKTTYFVGITGSMQSIELKKWTGTEWITL
jgi:prepilin-type N-terminal cleavage/methylation domain-containing protein